ncbi:MAG: hypothetical protein B7Z26_01385 [Asticcacaulis sp. 32-58-5]|nr:MAG: hypothetical protein B7Z26_01385 [Asticcacaulis sp. 32-58-5]
MRAFADRMLETLDDLPPPQDVAEVERTVRTGLLIERLYARLDASERSAPKYLTDEEVEQSHQEWNLKLAALREKHDAVCAKMSPPVPNSSQPPQVQRAIDRLRRHDILKPLVDELETIDFDAAVEATPSPSSPIYPGYDPADWPTARLDNNSGILWLDDETILAAQNPPWWMADHNKYADRFARGELKLILPNPDSS